MIAFPSGCFNLTLLEIHPWTSSLSCWIFWLQIQIKLIKYSLSQATTYEKVRSIISILPGLLYTLFAEVCMHIRKLTKTKM